MYWLKRLRDYGLQKLGLLTTTTDWNYKEQVIKADLQEKILWFICHYGVEAIKS